MSVLHPGFRRPSGQVKRKMVGGGAGSTKEKREDQQAEGGQEKAGVRVTGADSVSGSRQEVGGGRAEVARPSMACP